VHDVKLLPPLVGLAAAMLLLGGQGSNRDRRRDEEGPSDKKAELGYRSSDQTRARALKTYAMAQPLLILHRSAWL
jgi:hypothetical protein